MAKQEEFNSLDELFRKTFDDLPESPSTADWDQPGDRVWQHVQARIKPGRQGWTNNQILLAAAAAVAIALALYFAFARPKPAPADPAPVLPASSEQALTPPRQPETLATVPAPESAPESAPAQPRKPVYRQPSSPKTLLPPAEDKPATAPASAPTQTPPANTPGQRPAPTGSALLPGSNPAPPNTTELRRNQNAPNSPKIQPLPLTPRRWQAPPLPASFKVNWPVSDTKKQ